DEAAVHGAVQLLEVGEHKGVAVPVEEAAHGDEAVLGVGDGRVAARAVAERLPAAVKVQRHHHALPVQVFRLVESQLYGLAVGNGGIHHEPAVGRGNIGNVAVLAVGLGK